MAQTKPDSSQVVFKPSGAGAVDTTVQEKQRETVSPEDKGADPTGATDATSAVQKCIDDWVTNRNLEIKLVGQYLVNGTLRFANLETDTEETRLKFVGGGTLIKNNAGYMFDKPASGQVLQSGHLFFDAIRFKGANLNGQTFIINGDNIIRTHFIGCFGTGINIAKATGYLQTIYCTAGTTWRKWSGYLFDCNYLFDVKWDGIAEAGDGFLITRDAAADPACNSLKISGNIEGLSGVSGPAIKAGVCFATEITALYCEQNSGGDIDFNGGTGFHKGLTIQSCGFQPSTAQKANPNYYPVITGKGAQDSITLIGNASTHNLFDVTVGNESAIVDSGNWVAAGKNKFSPTSPRLFRFEGRKFTAALLPGYGVSLDSLTGAIGFEATRSTVNGEQVAAEILSGTANPAVSPGDYGNRNWKAGTIVFSSNPTVAPRQYGAGVVHDALILGWSCTTSGAPGSWVEIPIMLPY